MQQQQQQQRAAANHSFYRANRPGNLNILDMSDNSSMPCIMSANAILTTNHSSYMSADYNQREQPCSAGYMTAQQQHFQAPQIIQQGVMNNPVKQQQQQQHMVPMSPSYNTTNNGIQTSTAVMQNANDGFQHPRPVSLPPPQSPALQPFSPSYKASAAAANAAPQFSHPSTPVAASNTYDQQQSYTPKYSPSYSMTSAHIVNKQAQYFNFDTSNIYVGSDTGSLSQPKQQPQQQAYASQQPMSMTSHLASPRYINTQQPQQAQQQQQQQAYVFNNYQNMPHTPLSPASALPLNAAAPNTAGAPSTQATTAMHHNLHANNQHLQTNNTFHQQQRNHSLSVPNSPLLHPSANSSNMQHSSVFQFNSSSLSTSIQHPMSAHALQSSRSSYNRFFGGPPAPNSVVANAVPSPTGTSASGLLDTSASAAEADVSATVGKKPDLINANTFTENDVDMVHEVINDMIQKEEIANGNQSPTATTTAVDLRLPASSNSAPKEDPSSVVIDNSELIDPSVFVDSSQQATVINVNDTTLLASSNVTDSENLSIDINNNTISNNNNNNNINANISRSSSGGAIQSNESVVTEKLSVASHFTTTNSSTTTGKLNAEKAFSFSNLSEAAAAEFELNYSTSSANTSNNNSNNNNNNNNNNNATNEGLHSHSNFVKSGKKMTDFENVNSVNSMRSIDVDVDEETNSRGAGIYDDESSNSNFADLKSSGQVMSGKVVKKSKSRSKLKSEMMMFDGNVGVDSPNSNSNSLDLMSLTSAMSPNSAASISSG
jgi:hypothetical protein